MVAGMLAAATALQVAPLAYADEQEPDGLRLSGEHAEVVLGDRLFFETRFAQFFFAHGSGDVNKPLTQGDRLVDTVPAVDRVVLPSPFRGQSISCRQCHFGDDFVREGPLAGRTYTDFSRHSLVPERGDGIVSTPRNSSSMVGLGLPREVPVLYHSDGEFTTAEDLTVASFTGRNFGWLPDETTIATAHIARVIREDAGINARYVRDKAHHGIPYRVVMLGTAPDLPASLRLPARYRIDVLKASDDQVLAAVAKLMHAYMDSIRFGTHNTFRDTASPYDLFLAKNGLPAGPEQGESNLDYSSKLLDLLQQRQPDTFNWVKSRQDGAFELHDQPYQFGESELRGLKLFLSRAGNSSSMHVGNCVTCHTAPQFTDYRLHNTGVSQAEYDATFGEGSFARLVIPGLAERNAHFEDYLPPTPFHPHANARFRTPPVANKPSYADLGAWNIFGNPDLPKPQQALTQILCARQTGEPDSVLRSAVAAFKTPSIRDLGQSNPYFHSGAADTIEDTLQFYLRVSVQARSGHLRNGSPEVAGIDLLPSDVPPLAAFLRSLNEDYH